MQRSKVKEKRREQVARIERERSDPNHGPREHWANKATDTKEKQHQPWTNAVALTIFLNDTSTWMQYLLWVLNGSKY